MAVICNPLYTCDLPGGSKPRQSRGMLFDRNGERQWFTGIEHRHAPPGADGRAFELGFSPSGKRGLRPCPFDAATGTVILTRQQPLPGATARPTAGDVVRLGDMKPALDLPAGFIPLLRFDSAHPPEGDRIAILARRFSGAGEVRAIRIHNLATGRLRRMTLTATLPPRPVASAAQSGDRGLGRRDRGGRRQRVADLCKSRCSAAAMGPVHVNRVTAGLPSPAGARMSTRWRPRRRRGRSPHQQHRQLALQEDSRCRGAD